MRPIQLSPRLRSVADLVPQNAVLADIGTDHGFLPIYLLQRNQIKRAVAADLREGPLSKAKANTEKYGLSDRMEFRLCDGLSAVKPEDADTISIAGMGGETIAQILEAAPWTKDGNHKLLLQPMTSAYDLRNFSLNKAIPFCLNTSIGRIAESISRWKSLLVPAPPIPKVRSGPADNGRE